MGIHIVKSLLKLLADIKRRITWSKEFLDWVNKINKLINEIILGGFKRNKHETIWKCYQSREQASSVRSIFFFLSLKNSISSKQIVIYFEVSFFLHLVLTRALQNIENNLQKKVLVKYSHIGKIPRASKLWAHPLKH